MGVRRYSRDQDLAAWQRRFDYFQDMCRGGYPSPTIGELIEHGIRVARWSCRGGWDCGHSSEEFELTRFGPGTRVHLLKRNYICTKCGRDRPNLNLLYYGERG